MAAPNGKPELTFVVTTSPNDENNAANKRRVRSVAALKSWPARRKRAFGQVAESGGNASIDELEAPGPSTNTTAKRSRPIEADEPSAKRQRVPLPSAATSSSSQQAIHRGLPTPASSSSSRQAAVDAFEALRTEPCMRDVETAFPCKCQRCQPYRGFQPAQDVRTIARRSSNWDRILEGDRTDIVLLTPPGSPRLEMPLKTTLDSFNCCPVPYKPWFDGILHHMLTVYAPRGWPTLKISNTQGLLWERFMTQHALAEPALFYVRLLFASGDLVRLGCLSREVSYWLRSQAIEAINQAIKDPARATSDPLILAIGRIALHESLYGDRHASNTMHRPAQQRMILLRGGMSQLQFPELVKRLMRWSDSVMSMRGGTERFIEDEAEKPNFTVTESVDVLEKWVPDEGKALRRKLRIADLINEEPKT